MNRLRSVTKSYLLLKENRKQINRIPFREMEEPVKKRRGRPPTKKNIHHPQTPQEFESFDEDAAAGPAAVDNEPKKKKNAQPSDALRELSKQVGYRGIPAALVGDARERFGDEVVSKLVAHCENDESKFTAHFIVLSQACRGRGEIPDNFLQDPYWSMTEEERERMMEEAFDVEDDSVELSKVKPGTFICRRCKGNRILQWERQLRSADEAASQFFKCADCRHIWRED